MLMISLLDSSETDLQPEGLDVCRREPDNKPLSDVQKQLEPFESIPVSPSNSPGQAPSNNFALLPRPLEEGELASNAPPLAHPRNCDSRYVRVTVSAIPAQQAGLSAYPHAQLATLAILSCQ